ncbi:MAG: sulfatase [Thermoanaerobaculales bacterium]|jgi:arylsulfatase A-like enzyme|nr:sulfatase [Thermoanaerobaculales bacterium]
MTALPRVVVGLLAAVGSIACGAPDPGWARLWPDEWVWHHHGERWVLGVDAGGRSFFYEGTGALLRGELLNPGTAPATVRLGISRDLFEWTVGPGESMAIEARLRRGEARIDAPPGVVLGGPRIGRPLADPRRLVVVLVDTLRADHVTPELMPRVTAAFAGGRRWLDVTASSSWTLPSVATLFTGRPVLELTSPEGEVVGIPEGLPTWAQRLHRAGFEGGAVVANYTVHALNGHAAGFSSYTVPDGHGTATAPDGSWVVGEARRWLAAHAGEDGFLYLHLMDPHEPYRDHSGGAVAPPLGPLATREREATAEEARRLRELYAGEVRHVDEVLSPLLAELGDDATVVLTSDHGEGLGEHGAWAHGLTLWREAVEVPLLVRGPGVAAGEVAEPVQLADLAATLVDLAGLPDDGSLPGRSLLDGGSARPIVSATFSAGPLRWAWRRGSQRVMLRTAAQPGLGAASRARLEEVRPLPPGAFVVDLADDPAEERPGVIPEELELELATVFAADAGRMVPGLQVMATGTDGPATVVLEVGGRPEVVQAWSVGPIEVVRDGRGLEIRCADAAPLCAVALSAASTGAFLTPVAGQVEWRGVVAGVAIDPRELAPPDRIDRGAWLWWNPERPLVVGGHAETLERLRALGYID